MDMEKTDTEKTKVELYSAQVYNWQKTFNDKHSILNYVLWIIKKLFIEN